MSGEGRSLTLESDVDDGVVLGLGIFVNLHKLFSDKTVLGVCVDAGLHKVLVRYTNPVLVVDAVDECLSKVSVVEERLEWEIIFSSFDGCKSTLNDWKNSPSSVDARCGGGGGVKELVLKRFVAQVGVEVPLFDQMGSGWISSSERVRSMTSGDGIKSSH